MRRSGVLGLMLAAASALALAQELPPPPPGGGGGQPGGPPPRPARLMPAAPDMIAPPPPQAQRPPMERAMRPGPRGRWWNNAEMAQKLGLTADQQKRMDDIFQQNRLKLIDLNAAVQKEEVIMEPLMGADQPDEAKIVAQIDKVAQGRAELEKANARFLLAIRRVLTADQWKKLKEEEPRAAGVLKPAAPRPARR